MEKDYNPFALMHRIAAPSACNDVRDRHCKGASPWQSGARGLVCKHYGALMYRIKQGFSLIELLISLIIISVIAAIFTPIITKKLQKTDIGLTSSEEITTECSNSPNYGGKCTLCTKKYCIQCGLDDCESGKYANTKKCECEECSNTFGTSCIECQNSGCTKCQNKHYIKDGKCEPCPTGHYCDGVNDYATCPGKGYYCDDTGVHKCSEKYSYMCSECTAQNCTNCDAKYYLQGGRCHYCGFICTKCRNENYCEECMSDYILNPITHKCDRHCSEAMDGCRTCYNATTCKTCYGTHYLNSAQKCSLCSISNCIQCKQGEAPSSPICEACKGGYYLQNGRCHSCTSKYGQYCASCDDTKCLSCTQEYHLSAEPATEQSCESNDNKYNCSDSNFMQIGNLCITRRNMGDSATLTIPNTVTVVEAGSEHCYGASEKCCWRGTTAGGCDSANGNYSGCTRTVCNRYAAQEICSKFKYQGKNWRLPKNEEVKDWNKSSVGLGINGLMLCDGESGYNSATCGNGAVCIGSYDTHCRARHIWHYETYNTLFSYVNDLLAGNWGKSGYVNNAYAYSVRCVSEL